MGMQVIGKVPCVTRAGEDLFSLAPGRTYELPDAVAQKLVDAGLCVPVEDEESAKVPAQQQTTTTEEPAKPAPAKKAPAKKAPAKPRSRKAPTKSAGAAPENKGADGAQD